MFEKTLLKRHTCLKLLAALALLSTVAPVREAHAQFISGAGYAEAIAVGGVALSGIFAAGGIITGVGTTLSNKQTSYRPGWAVPSFVSAGLGIGLAAVLIPVGLSSRGLEGIVAGAGLIHGIIGVWNLVAGLQNMRYKAATKTGPTLTPVALGDFCRKGGKQWFGVGVQLSSW